MSHFTAQLTVALFGLLLGMTAYRLARMLFAPLAALGATLMLLGAPEMASWGRQVMLDIPVHAVALLAVVEFVQYLRSGRERYLWLAVLAFAAVDRIPPVGLDPLARLSRDQRWRDNGAIGSPLSQANIWSSMARWDYYVRALPGPLGWPVVGLAVLGLVLLWRRAVAREGRWLATFF